MWKHIAIEWLSSTLSDTSSSSSDEDEILTQSKPKRRKIVKVKCYVEAIVAAYDSKSFQEHYRINRVRVYMLIDRLLISGYNPTYKAGRENVTAEKAFLLTLWYLGNTETFRQVSDRFDVSPSSAHRCLLRVVHFLLSLRQEYITWPNAREAEGISQAFRRKRGIENIMGAIDGCHVRINKPKHDQESYINRKSFHSVLIQGICDTKKKFLDVFCGEPGSLHDARLLRKSAIYRKALNPNYFGNKFLLGDSAYPSLHWLVPPFKDNGALTNQHKIFNFRHSSSRMVIEHAYGLLKGRFRRLQHFHNTNIFTVAKCVMAACILHNICIVENDDTDVIIPDISDDLQSETCALRYTLSRGSSRREELFQNMFNEDQ